MVHLTMAKIHFATVTSLQQNASSQFFFYKYLYSFIIALKFMLCHLMEDGFVLSFVCGFPPPPTCGGPDDFHHVPP
jgi:hypothetical protein